MIEELREKFLGRFLEGAAGRLSRARVGLEEGDRKTVSHEMHALAGEAALLELDDVARRAREAEQLSRRWLKSNDDAEAASFRVALEGVDQAVRAVSEAHARP